MSGRPIGPELVIASHNPGKVREIAELVAPYRVTTRAAADLNLDEPEETATSFAGNAALKAEAAARAAGLAALADDSGLVVPALGGAPGIYSARWAGPDRDFAAAMARLQAEMADKSDFSAHFTCALCVAWPDGERIDVDGQVHGTLVFPPRGGRGFGYDPVFVAAGHDLTFGEMDPGQKASISHRAVAFRRLIARLFPDRGR